MIKLSKTIELIRIIQNKMKRKVLKLKIRRFIILIRILMKDKKTRMIILKMKSNKKKKGDQMKIFKINPICLKMLN